MALAIHATELKKRYQIGERPAYGALRDSLAATARGMRRRILRQEVPPDRNGTREIWALDGVSFDVADGEVVGIIGRNGSGKSTLLKILSRITEPTSGQAIVRGRVGSLLEVGTGFHPELTGRENVFVNGAILGMSRREIVAKFDEIVAFAEVERFIDTPVKHYSSGMQMRLAFAVAAHLEPHILLVDEVLAVGDLAFQKKCLGKMNAVSRHGRTVVFVSHQMSQIRRLCGRVIWLDAGRVRAAGGAGETIGRYEQAILSGEALGPGQCFLGWTLADDGHTVTDGLQPVTFRLRLALRESISRGHLGINLTDESDHIVAGWAFEPLSLRAGDRTLSVTVPLLPIRAGSYRLTFTLFDGGNNLNWGRFVEQWVGVPSLVVDAPPLGHSQDAWAGMLNLPATLASDDASNEISTVPWDAAGVSDDQPIGESAAARPARL